ncbi:MAG: hypothetical protein Q8K93_26250 [Reyranella sp.]|nr:hypothetical protein [Reyranella sp.]
MVDTVIVEADSPPVSAVSWPAIIAGGFVAAAMTLVLLALGAGIGFSVVSPWSGAPDIATTKAATVGGIFMAVTAVMASALGGYVTGRLRTRWASALANEVYFRDTAHGVLAWAFATVMGAALLASAATIVTGGAAAGAGPAAALAAVQGEGRQASAWQAPLLDRLFRPDYAALTGGAGARAAGVFAGGRDLAVDRAAASRLFATAYDRSGTGLTADDRQYLVQMVAARTGLAPADAERRVVAIEAEARIAADTARRVGMHLSFWLVASMLLGAVAAGLAATEGGAARDERS